ncbi:hypothetical protein CP960_01475 [Malaciobacter halophilus]|uniref:Uncharacterized protein n=1 Tax=Malaciobacter halophilus TaxID=197482 RepID=A0A2N1J627_9BACT|nr:hypothetical protein [Malaciobacter halophilus]AXH09527.1 hypothetical protein AHALO_1149 [Malaciobacter halophilus]PKI82009.1 hypothetical protein CP960_01475 [Malaciobacter halophilus]
MESIIALEELIKENEIKIALQERQIKNHETGVNKLSRMGLASAENSLELATQLVEKYKSMLEKLQSIEGEALREKEQLAILTERKKYFDAQPSRIKLNKEESSDKKLEVLRILDELPEGIEFEDKELFEMAEKSLELNLFELEEFHAKLEDIKSEFKAIKEQIEDENLQEFQTIDFLIPIVVLHFYVLKSNIQEHIKSMNEKALQKQKDLEEEKKEKIKKIEESYKEQEELLQLKQADKNTKKQELLDIQSTMKTLSNKLLKTKNIKIEKPVEKRFPGFPKYEDWWIRELWSSHQAYFALFRWKKIINQLCVTTEQKKAWSIIFDRWVFIKKLLNDKGKLAYHYHFAFDSLLSTYAELEEELVVKNIESMETIINKITAKEDFTKNVSFHKVITPYLEFKTEKINKNSEQKQEDVLF